MCLCIFLLYIVIVVFTQLLSIRYVQHKVVDSRNNFCYVLWVGIISLNGSWLFQTIVSHYNNDKVCCSFTTATNFVGFTIIQVNRYIDMFCCTEIEYMT